MVLIDGEGRPKDQTHDMTVSNVRCSPLGTSISSRISTMKVTALVQGNMPKAARPSFDAHARKRAWHANVRTRSPFWTVYTDTSSELAIAQISSQNHCS